MTFPEKSKRQTCWQHRDLYWQCLEEKEQPNLCKEFRKNFEKHCPVLWVKHFDRKREYNVFKEKMEKEGYQPTFPQNEQQQAG